MFNFNLYNPFQDNNNNNNNNNNRNNYNIYIQGGPGKGLANNMWAIATAVYYKEKYGMGNIILKANDSILYGTCNKFGRNTYRSKDNNTIITYGETFFKKLKFCLRNVENCDIVNNDFSCVKIIPKRDIEIRGFCANLDLFHDYHEKIQNYLHLDDKETLEYIKKTYENLEKGIMIGIRRGPDGGFKQFTKESYKNALNKLIEMNVDISHLFILTDTKDAWKDILDLNDEFPATEIREDDYTQFLAGMMCKHFVITESSYHWWIAYMGIIKSPEKKVLYFDTNDYNERNLILPEWIKVDW